MLSSKGFFKKNVLALTLTLAAILVGVGYYSSHRDASREQLDNLLVEQRYLDAEELKMKMVDYFDINGDPTVEKSHNSNAGAESIKRQLKILKDVLKSKTAGLAERDNAFIAFLENNNIARADKVSGLWSLAKSMGLENADGIFTLDYLSTLHPIELSDELINQFNSVSTTGVKLRIMDVLYESLDITNPDIQNAEQLAAIEEKFDIIQDFFYDQLQSTANNDIFKESVTLYSRMASPDDSRAVVSAAMAGEYNSGKMDAPAGMSLLTELAVSSSESQTQMLPELLDSLRSGSLELEAKESVESILISAANADLEQGIFSENEFARSEIVNYLSENEPVLQAQLEPGDDFEKYYSWVSARSKLESGPESGVSQNPGASLANEALLQGNPIKISSIVLYSDDQVLSEIRQAAEYGNMLNTLKLALNDQSISGTSRTVIEEALGTLAGN